MICINCFCVRPVTQLATYLHTLWITLFSGRSHLIHRRQQNTTGIRLYNDKPSRPGAILEVLADLPRRPHPVPLLRPIGASCLGPGIRHDPLDASMSHTNVIIKSQEDSPLMVLKLSLTHSVYFFSSLQ